MTRLLPDRYIGDPDPQGRLARFWQGPPGVLFVVGPEGVGKTRRVREASRPMPCRWIDGTPRSDAAQRTALNEACASDDRVVLDGFDALQATDLPEACTAWVVITRRTELPGPTVYTTPLPFPQGVELLRARTAPAPAAHLDAAELARIVASLDGLPGALEAAALTLEVATATSVAADLDAGTPLAQQLRKPWAHTWHRLAPPTQQHLGALATCRGGFDLPAASALWEVPALVAAERLAHLRRLGLVRACAEAGRFEVPASLVAEGETTWTTDDQTTWWHRHATHYTDPTGPVHWVGLPERWRPVPAAEQANFAAVCSPERHIPPEMAVRAAITLGARAQATGDIDLAAQHLQELVDPVAGATPLPELWQLRVHHLLGYLHVVAGDAELASSHIERARRLVSADPTGPHRLLLLQKAMWAHWRRGAPAEALAAAEEGAAAALDADNTAQAVDFIGMQAMMHSEAGRFDARARCLERLTALAHTPRGRSMRDVWKDAVARHDDAPVHISPDGIGLPRRLVVTTTLGKCLSLLWLGRTTEIHNLVQRHLLDLQEPRLVRTREAILAAVAVVGPSAPDSTAAFDAVLFDLATQGCPEGTAGYRLIRAGAFWRRGSVAQAAQQLDAALQEADQCGLHVLRDEFRIVRAVCEHANHPGGDVGLADLRDRQPMAWYGALHAQAVAMVDGTPPPPAAGPVRWSMQLLHRVAHDARLQSHDPDRVELVVAPDGTGFRVGTTQGDLRRKRTARRFLIALLRHHEQHGAELPRADAIEAAWPGERMLPESSAARLYTMVWQLRRLGLAGLLLTTPSGYALHDDVVVRRGPL